MEINEIYGRKTIHSDSFFLIEDYINPEGLLSKQIPAGWKREICMDTDGMHILFFDPKKIQLNYFGKERMFTASPYEIYRRIDLAHQMGYSISLIGCEFGGREKK